MGNLDLIDVIVYLFVCASTLMLIGAALIYGFMYWLNRNEPDAREDDEEQIEFIRQWNSRRDRAMSGLESRMATPRGEQ